MSNKRPSQTDMVLDYMRMNGSITQKEAYENLGISRLAARISEIVNDREIPVHRVTENFVDHRGVKGTCVRYSLEVCCGT